MKKVLTFLCALCLCVCSCVMFVGCGEKGNGKVRINEVTHSVFYAPLYLAINLGYMSDAGIDIELTNGGGSDASMTALLSGSADIALMGPETVVYVEARGSTNHPVVFGQLTKKDGSFLISKHPIQNFSFETSLAGKKAIVGRQGGMPAMTFEWVCNSNGLTNGENVSLDTDTSFNMMVPTFEASNDVEFCTMFEPTASEFVAAGKGYYVGSMGEFSGEIPYTCFMAYPSYISSNKEMVENFLKAVKKAYLYIVSDATNGYSNVGQALTPSFDGTSAESLAKAIKSYMDIDAWSSSPAMSKDSFNRLLTVLKNSQTLNSSANIEFTKVVDNSLANQI